MFTVRTLFPGSKIPVRTEIQIIPVLDEYLLVLLDGVDAGQAGDHTPPRMVKHHELRVGDEAVVRLVSQRGAIVLQISKLFRNVNCPGGFGGWVKDFVTVLVPSLAFTRAGQNSYPVVKCNNCVLFNFLPKIEQQLELMPNNYSTAPRK